MLKQITEQELAENGVVSAPDHLTGNPADVKAIFDRLVTHVVAKVVNEIIEAHNTLETDTNRRINEMAEDLKNHVDVDPSALKAENVAIASALVEKYGLTELLAATVHDALERAVSSTGDTMSGDLEVNSDKPSLRVGNPNGVKGIFAYDVANKMLDIGLVDVERQVDEEYGESGFVLGDRDGWYPAYGGILRVKPGADVDGAGLQYVTIDSEGNETSAPILHTQNLAYHNVARIMTGSYTGNGAYGAANPNTVAPGFTPKYLEIFRVITSGSQEIGFESVMRLVKPLAYASAYTTNAAGNASGSTVYDAGLRVKVDWGAASVSWFTEEFKSDNGGDDPVYTKWSNLQCNASGVKYHYIAIG